MVPFEIFGSTVSYAHSIATMTVSLAVSTQYTNVTDTYIARHPDTARQQELRYSFARLQSRGKNSVWKYEQTCG